MEIRTGTIVSGGHLKGKVLVKNTTVVGGVPMFQFARTDTQYLCTLLGFHRREKQKLGHVLGNNVVPELKKLRLSEYVKFCKLPLRRLVAGANMPEIGTIAPPAFPDIVAPPIKLAMDALEKPLRIELSTANIEYIAKVCKFLVEQLVEQKQEVKQKRMEKKRKAEQEHRPKQKSQNDNV